MEQTTPEQIEATVQSAETLSIMFQEYQSLAESTDKVTDRRQTVNTLFVSINALFLTGVGYLLLQFLQHILTSALFIVGFFAIALITTRLNSAWLKLSDQNRRMVDLRIRYLKALEESMRTSAMFPVVATPLKADEVGADGVNPLMTRGTYTLEDVLYNPAAKKQPFGFSRAEQQIGRGFSWAYWIALAFALVTFLATPYLTGLHFPPYF